MAFQRSCLLVLVVILEATAAKSSCSVTPASLQDDVNLLQQKLTLTKHEADALVALTGGKADDKSKWCIMKCSGNVLEKACQDCLHPQALGDTGDAQVEDAFVSSGTMKDFAKKENTALEKASSAKEISDMFPDRNGRCMTETGAVEMPTQVAEVFFCASKLRMAESAGNCLIYNVGVGTSDPFLSYIGSNFKGCKVFAFDPTVSNHTWDAQGGPQKVFGPNVSFFSYGLYGGTGSRHIHWSHPVYGNVTGSLYTLPEIQRQLGHTGKPISMFRCDCEGCEWGWIPNQMRADPTIFSRIHQMFIEVHFASSLRFSNDTMSQAPMLRKMFVDNFNVLHRNVNWGYEPDWNKIPEAAVAAGVEQGPCCREFCLVSKQ